MQSQILRTLSHTQMLETHYAFTYLSSFLAFCHHDNSRCSLFPDHSPEITSCVDSGPLRRDVCILSPEKKAYILYTRTQICDIPLQKSLLVCVASFELVVRERGAYFYMATSEDVHFRHIIRNVSFITHTCIRYGS